MKKIIQHIKKIDFPISKEINFNSFKNQDDLFYTLNSNLFENSNLNHTDRLNYLTHLRKVIIKNKKNFSEAHNLALSSKVEQELGKLKSAIEKSIRAHTLFENIINENKLAANGSIFAYSTLANIYSNLNLNNIALEYLYKAQKLIDVCENNYIPKIRINLNLGICYHAIKKYNKALKYLNEIYDAALKKKDYRTLIPIISNMSSVYFSKKEYDKCFDLCNEALHFLKNIDDVNYRPTILCDLAICYEKKSQLNKALKLYNEALDINIKLNAKNKTSLTINKIANIHFKQKKYEVAIKNYKQIINKYSNCKEAFLNASLQLSKITEIKKENESAYKYYKLYTKNLEEDIRQKELLYNDQNKNTVLSLEAYIDNIEKEKENSELKLELIHKKRELVTKDIKTLSENNFLTLIINKLQQDSLNDDSNIRKKIKDTIKLLNNRLDDSVDWKNFISIFNDLNPNFFDKINGNKNKLTELEIRVCAMIKFGFNTREIASILSITVRGVEQHRYRIKKKICSKTNLTTYLLKL